MSGADSPIRSRIPTTAPFPATLGLRCCSLGLRTVVDIGGWSQGPVVPLPTLLPSPG